MIENQVKEKLRFLMIYDYIICIYILNYNYNHKNEYYSMLLDFKLVILSLLVYVDVKCILY